MKEGGGGGGRKKERAKEGERKKEGEKEIKFKLFLIKYDFQSCISNSCNFLSS